MRILSLVLLLTFGSFGRAVADEDGNRETLRGIKALCVVIEDLRSDEIKDGLAVQQIRTDVELRLRKAGLVVATEEKTACLYINVNLLKLGSFYAYSLHVAMKQAAVTVRNGLTVSVPTWSVGSVTTVGSPGMSRHVRDQIGDKVEVFLNAYLSVNPK